MSLPDISFSIFDDFALDPIHPGLHDSEYVFRRRFYHSLCRSHRLAGADAPLIQYNQSEQALWGEIFILLEEVHQAYACKEYLAGKLALNLSQNSIPQIRLVSNQLIQSSGFGLAPAEGLLDFRDFFGLIGKGRLPCTQFLRHPSNPAFTPEPDMVHDLLGHVPLLVDSEVTQSMRAIGKAAQTADAKALLQLNRLYWFGIEFGLIESNQDVKIYGAGILSSKGEIQHSLSSKTDKREFVLDEVISSDYDPTKYQEKLFVIKSFKQLLDATNELVARF